VTANATILRRYTDLPALLYLLKESRITLLDPRSWDDQNDTHYLRIYKRKKGLKSVLALCFTEAGETYHHWRVFANGPSGVRIDFKREELLSATGKVRGLRAASVHYPTLKGHRKATVNTEDLPFLKRYGFQDEAEFRLIYESAKTKVTSKDIPIPLSCIDRITLSPWLNQALVPQVKSVIGSVRSRPHVKVSHSTLIGNDEWKKLGEGAL